MTLPMLTLEPKVLKLYPFQAWTIERLREALRRGHRRIILCAPTGSGKTEMAIYLIKEAWEKGKRAVFVADQRVLVKQTSDRFYEYGIPHGMAMSTATRDRHERVQVCSAQTVEKREYWNGLDLLVIDEAHVQRKKIVEFAKEWGGPVIGLTATPLTKGLNDYYETIVNATTTDKLLIDGYLAPLRIYAATEIDMTGAKKGNDGEWLRSEVRNRGGRIIGDIVSEWARKTQEHFGGPVKTLAFSADVAHGEDICRAFQLAGYDFRQSSYHDSDEDTRRLVKGFREGEFTGLVSVEKFVKGFDVPDVLCMIGARPYSTSLAAVIQQMGRGMRTAEGKEYCLYLDHAGNMAGWYEDVSEIWANGVDRLPDPKKKRKTRREGHSRGEVTCYGCGLVLPPGATGCPYCGAVRGRGGRTGATTVPGRMEPVVTGPGSRRWKEDRRWTWQQLCRVALNGKRDMDAAGQFAWKQYQVLYGEAPPKKWSFDPVEGEADSRVAKKVWSQIRAWRGGRRRSA